MKILRLFFILSLFFGVDANAQSKNIFTGYADIVEPLIPAVVNIYTIKQAPNPSAMLNEIFPDKHFQDFFSQFNLHFDMRNMYTDPKAISLGSGFLIDDSGFIVTNYHVIANASGINVKLHDNTELVANVIGVDPRTDLALLKVSSTKKLPYVKFGNSDAIRAGDVAIAIGNPLGFGGTVTHGIISSKARELSEHMDELIENFVQTDAPINSGNSGGPLFNINGEVIAVNTAIPSISRGTNIGIGFAIPSNTVSNIIGKLKQDGKISRGKLDIYTQDISKDIAEALGVKAPQGVLVVEVLPGGAAEKAGIKRGDILLEFSGKKIANVRKLELLVSEAGVDQLIKIKILRSGKEQIVNAKLSRQNHDSGDVKQSQFLSYGVFANSSAKFSDITPNLATKYNIKTGEKGVIVVDKFSASLDLKVGDIVQAADDVSIENIKDLMNVYNKAISLAKRSILLLVKRGGATFFVAFPLN